jgi:hypothetical protein
VLTSCILPCDPSSLSSHRWSAPRPPGPSVRRATAPPLTTAVRSSPEQHRPASPSQLLSYVALAKSGHCRHPSPLPVPKRRHCEDPDAEPRSVNSFVAPVLVAVSTGQMLPVALLVSGEHAPHSYSLLVLFSSFRSVS